LTYRILPVAEKMQSYWNRGARLVLVTSLTVICAAVTLYSHMVLGVEVVFTHLFYIPIVLAALWFGRKSYAVTAILGTLLVLTNVLASLGSLYEDLMRISVMLFVNTITVLLSESFRESEEVIARTEKKYRTIVEAARDAIITVNGSGKVVSWNRAAEKLFGYSEAEMMGENINTLISEINREKHDFSRIGDREVSLSISDVEAVRKDGTRFPVEISVFSWQTMDEKFVTAFIRDVTERKMAENALIESERKFRAVFDGVEDIITMAEIQDNGLPGRYLEVNRAAVEKLGYSREELLKMTPLDIGMEGERITDSIIRKLLREGSGTFNRTYISRDGRRIPVEVNSRLIELGGRTVAVSVARDITQRLENERRLRESEEKYRSLFNLSPEYILLLDPGDGKILDVNSTLARTIEIHPGDLRGRSIYELDFLSDDVKKEFRSKLEIIIRDGFVEPYEMVMTDPSGREYNVRVYNRLIHAEGMDCLLIVLSDISDLKRTQSMLERSLAEKELLLKEIHHRVKNNLMIISSLLSLQSSQVNDEETMDLFRESENRARSMALIHERLYRSEDLKNIDLAEYLGRLASEIFRSYSADSRIRMNLEIDELRVDVETAVPLGLIVNELLTNAVKHAFPDGEGTVTVSLRRRNSRVILEVSDDGKGFPEDIDWESSPSLGLQLVRSLTEQIDGEVEMISDGGTTFRITFKEKGLATE